MQNSPDGNSHFCCVFGYVERGLAVVIVCVCPLTLAMKFFNSILGLDMANWREPVQTHST